MALVLLLFCLEKGISALVHVQAEPGKQVTDICALPIVIIPAPLPIAMASSSIYCWHISQTTWIFSRSNLIQTLQIATNKEPVQESEIKPMLEMHNSLVLLQIWAMLLSTCYGLKVHVPPEFTYWSPNSQSDGICRWGFEGYVMGVELCEWDWCYDKKRHEWCGLLPWHEDTAGRWLLPKKREPSLSLWAVWCLILDLQALHPWEIDVTV